MPESNNHRTHSENYQHLPQAVVAMAKEYPDGFVVAAHAHPRAQLLYATQGVMQVTIGEQLWITPPRRALWVPAGVLHALKMAGSVSMRTLYIDQSATAMQIEGCRVIEVSALLRELILEALAQPLDYQPESKADLICRLMLFEISSATDVNLRIPMPKLAPLLDICNAILANPGSQDTLERWAERINVSGRTLARHFMDECGMSFGQWRQQVRLAQAICKLAVGQSSKQIAADLGYQSVSAFTAMFRRTFGQPPQNYFYPEPKSR